MSLPIDQSFVDAITCDVRCCFAGKYYSYLDALEDGDMVSASALFSEAQKAFFYLNAITSYDVESEDCITEYELGQLISKIKLLCGCGSGGVDYGLYVPLPISAITGWQETGVEHLILTAQSALASYYLQYIGSVEDGDIVRINRYYNLSKEAYGILFGLQEYVNSPLAEEDNCLSAEMVSIYVSKLVDLCGCLDEGLRPAVPITPDTNTFILTNLSEILVTDNDEPIEYV